MNRKQRRIQKRRVRRVGVIVASQVMLGTTAGIGGAAFAGGTPGGFDGVGGANKNDTHESTNKTFVGDGSVVFRTHTSSFDGAKEQYNYTGIDPATGTRVTVAYHGCAFLTSNGQTAEQPTPGRTEVGCLSGSGAG